jgi:hypothetical protein
MLVQARYYARTTTYYIVRHDFAVSHSLFHNLIKFEIIESIETKPDC